MIHRDELSVGDTLVYTPGGIEVTVEDVTGFCVMVCDSADGSLHEVSPEEMELYEHTSSQS